MTPDQRIRQIQAEEDADAQREQRDDEASAASDADLPRWVGVWLAPDDAQAAIRDAFSATWHAIESKRDVPGAVDIGGVMSFAVAMLEDHLAQACPDNALGAACARIGVEAHVEGNPVSKSPLAFHTAKKLH